MVEKSLKHNTLQMITHLDGDILYAEKREVALTHWKHVVDESCHKTVQLAILHIQEQKKSVQLALTAANQQQHVMLVPQVDQQGSINAVYWLSEDDTSLRPYQAAFHQSAISQWIFDPRPLHEYFRQLKIRDLKQLKKHIEAGKITLATLRALFYIVDANASAVALYNVGSIGDFQRGIPLQARDKDIINACSAVFNIGASSSRETYQTDISVQDKVKSLWVSCEIPAKSTMQNGILISMVDITIVKLAEKDSAEREQFLSTILKTIPDVVIVYDFKRRIPIFQNYNISAMLGYSEQDVADTQGRLLNYIAHPDDNLGGDIFKTMASHIEAGEVYEHNLRLQHNNGQWHHYFFRSAALDRDENGSVINSVVVARDITEVLMTRQIYTEQQRRYQLLADNLSDVIITLDMSAKVNYVSPSISNLLAQDAYGFINSSDCLSLLGLSGQLEIWRKTLVKSFIKVDNNHLDFFELIQTHALHKDGHLVPVEVQVSLLRDEHLLLEGMILVVRDITQRLQHEADKQLAVKVFENSAEAIYITNSYGEIVQVNDAFVSISGYERAAVLGKKPADLGSGWHDINFTKDVKPVLDKVGRWQGELISRRASGEAFMVSMTISNISGPASEVLGHITSFSDITEAKSTEEGIRKLAYFDHLTDLPNRTLFNDRLTQALQRANRTRQYLALLFLDLDGFKLVNDAFGHAVGDRLLAQVGARLKDCIRVDDTVARLGGDEFAVILHTLATKELAETAAAMIANKIIEKINADFLIENNTISIGVSIGVALYPDDANASDELMRKADAAMYHAKHSGKNNVQFFAVHMHEQALVIKKKEKEFFDALNDKQLKLVFLPKLKAHAQDVYGFEALLRWQHPQEGLLMPASFLNVLDDLSLSVKVGEWVVEQACEQLQLWRHTGRAHWTLSVNVFAQHYRSPSFVRYIESMLAAYEISPELMTLEFSESMVMKDVGFAYAVMSELKSLGVRISLDDFGTGLFSLASLNRLPIDEVKIHRQCIFQIENDENQFRLIKSIVNLADVFGFSIVAEGVETQSQLDRLLSINCHNVQGFLFHRPMFSADVDEVFAV